MNRLKEIRTRKGFSISMLARLSGVSRPTIYRLESGKDTTVNSSTLKALADALEEPVSSFFEDTV